MNLPANYQWLNAVVGQPRMIVEALALYGVHETVGPGDNPTILSWAKEIGLDSVYKHDETPWCGLFAALVCHRADKPYPPAPLWALNWRAFGDQSPQAGLGDILVFVRPGGGHVGLYVADDDQSYHVLGGNEMDEVTIIRILKSRCVAVRRPVWKIAQPAGVKPYHVLPTGELSENET